LKNHFFLDGRELLAMLPFSAKDNVKAKRVTR